MTDPMSDAPVDNMDPMETQETATVQPPIEDGDDLQQAQRELESQKDKYLRLAAEYDNFRRRAVKERLYGGNGGVCGDPTGHPFDPAQHEAVSTAPAMQPDEDGVVAICFQVGYVINGHVLRPARVVVKQWTGA